MASRAVRRATSKAANHGPARRAGPDQGHASVEDPPRPLRLRGMPKAGRQRLAAGGNALTSSATAVTCSEYGATRPGRTPSTGTPHVPPQQRSDRLARQPNRQRREPSEERRRFSSGCRSARRRRIGRRPEKARDRASAGASVRAAQGGAALAALNRFGSSGGGSAAGKFVAGLCNRSGEASGATSRSVRVQSHGHRLPSVVPRITDDSNGRRPKPPSVLARKRSSTPPA